MSKDKTIIKHVYGNILRVAIPLTIRTRTLQEGVEVETEEDFHPNPNYPTIIDLYKGFGQHYTFDATVEGNVASFIDQGDTPIGIYQVEVTCKDSNGNPVRYMVRAIIEIVDATIDAGIEAGIEFNAESYTLEGAVFFYAKGESLYQLMVEEGRFVGTLEEFLDQYENTLKAASYAAKTTLETNAQVQDAEELRVTAENERKSAETTRNTKESEREASEEIRNNSESTRVEKENQREASETTRKSNEDARVTAERMRATAEVNRNANETTRQENEETRESHERTRVQNETERQRDEDLRTNAERTRVTAESGRVQAEEARAIQSAADHAQAENDHSASVNATEGAEQVNANLEGSTVTITDRHGNATSVDIGFSIYRTYSSVAEMNADADNVEEGKFVLIATTSPTSTENARLYVRNGNSATSPEPFRFLSDLDQASSEAWADWLENMKPAIESRIATADNDHSQAVSDHGIATADHTQASQDHTVAIGDHTQAENDHSTASQDHTTAASDHEQALQDHTQANTDHTTAVADHEEMPHNYVSATQAQNFSDAQKAQARQNIGAMPNMTVDDEPTEGSVKPVMSGGVYAALEKKANKDGYYGSMTVGTAENLVGRGSVEAEYTGVRTSAGTADIGSGSATIVKMMGNSVKWNQIIRNGDFKDGRKYWDGLGLVTTEEGDGYMRFIPNKNTLFISNNFQNRPETRKYFFKIVARGETGVSLGLRINASLIRDTKSFVLSPDTWNESTGFFTATDVYSVTLKSNKTGVVIDVKEVFVIDLTFMFGAGNEPSTVDDFEKMFPFDYYDYNPCEIINNGATGITTYGFNLYDYATGKAYLPGKYSDYPQEYEICGTFTSISYTDINGNTYVPELTDGKFFNVSAPGELTVVGGNNTDTLVHLVWSGWRNEGEPDYAYESFWKHTLPLNLKTRTGKLNGEGESVVVFPYGLAKIGDVQDEIKGNVATKKIGRRAYEDGDESNTSVMTDGTNTQYVLPTPQTYILDEELPSNYRIDDFGTEQVEPAYTDVINAPIRYEVQYAMNAVDAIRRLPDTYLPKSALKQTIGKDADSVVSQKVIEENYAHKTGVENELVVGAAKALAGNQRVAKDATSFVVDGDTGIAKVNEMMGNSRAWNQLYNDAMPTLDSTHKYCFVETVEGTITKSIGTTYEYTEGSTNRQCFDLTLIYNNTNVPTTVEQFEADIQTWFSKTLDEYFEYDAGSILSAKIQSLEVYDSEETLKNTLPINITSITGKLSGEGDSVTIFPEGMRSAGTVFDSLIVDDDGYARKAVVRMGEYAITGNESFTVGASEYFKEDAMDAFFSTSILKSALGSKVLCTHLTNDTNAIWLTKGYPDTIGVYTNQVHLNISNEKIGAVYGTDTTGQAFKKFKAWIKSQYDNGTPLIIIYILATPLEYTLDEPILITFNAYNGGMIKQVKDDMTMPARIAITFALDAVGVITGLPQDYVSKDSLQSMLNAMQTAGLFASYTMTYNASTQKYDFTFTPNS